MIEGVDLPLFTLIALVLDGKHLLFSTLDSLQRQTERRFEVVLIDGTGQNKIEEIAKSYPELPIQVLQMKGRGGSEMMNEGVRVSKGKYLQFLLPGDRYLSHEGLSYLSDLIEKNKEPHLIYSGFLMRGSEAVLFALDHSSLKKGMFSRDSWFLRQAVIDLGGFDRAFSYRSSFDFLCRLFLKKGMNAVCSRRVLTDRESRSSPPKAMAGYAFETYQILYRHFGLWPALRWVFIQDHLQMFRWLGGHFKRAFCKDSH